MRCQCVDKEEEEVESNLRCSTTRMQKEKAGLRQEGGEEEREGKPASFSNYPNLFVMRRHGLA